LWLSGVALLGLVAGTALMFPKLWRVTPMGFEPEVRISVLDYLQCRSLKRAAARAQAEGRGREASFAWLSAIANNPADRDAVRGSLEQVLADSGSGAEQQREVMWHAQWLLRLGATNAADLPLVVRAYERYRLYDVLEELLAPREAALTGLEAGAYLRALFYLDRIERFANAYARLAPKADGPEELELFWAAYLAGWGDPAQAGQGRARLDAAVEIEPRRLLALRLRLAVAGRRADVTGFERDFAALEGAWADSALDHARRWDLLLASGRKEEAARHALAYGGVPSSALELVRVAEAYGRLGLDAQADDLLERHTLPFRDVMAVWVLRAHRYLESRRWEDVLRLANEMRRQRAAGSSLLGYSYYLEGRVHAARGIRASADERFARAGGLGIEHAGLGLGAAAAMAELGYLGPADEVLRRLEAACERRLDYWFLRFSVAHERKQLEVMARAAERAYELEPGHPVHVNNRAAVLLLKRERPEEVIGLTLRLMAQDPRSVVHRINHSLALIQNERYAEAAAVLEALPLATLSGPEATAYQLCRFEIYAHGGEAGRAWAALDRVDRGYLFPIQIERIDRLQKQLPERGL
jgi:hypothetical protein